MVKRRENDVKHRGFTATRLSAVSFRSGPCRSVHNSLLPDGVKDFSPLSMNNTHCDTRVALFWNTSANYYSFVTFTTSVVIAAMSPVTVAGNLLVALAIRRNESHRSPSYRLLGVLSLEYFILGLIFQPLYAAKEIVSVLRQSFLTKKSFLFYNHLIFGGFGTYIIAVTILTITYMAIERWLYMTRRSWMDSGRVGRLFVLILFLPIPLIVYRTLHILTGTYCQITNTVIICLLVFCFLTTTLTYLQVFRIIRRHQQQVQANGTLQSVRQPSINMAKYKKSVVTVLLILALFYLCYLPFVLNVILLTLWEKSLELITAFKVSTLLTFVSAMLNPCLYCWRIREIRNGVRQLSRKIFCKNSSN